ncbi:hypothetical protein E0Z10_g7944 [Xylaria hypoxylon]|uniref:C2H2-type domain-containing protein n=1 Tax=Xylaria hypoxylon TaxID=37992 RepID=A0A4Z0YNV0_9PEZI|nr:hypothetical protein E0Z10_g7944 [Xylaria hypoxylon]
MGAGLDELIESLLTEIAFSGVRGCSVPNLLVAIDSFYKSSDKGSDSESTRVLQEIKAHGSDTKPQQGANRHDLAVASKVWIWLANRSDVSIGINRQFNHLSLEQVLALPEEEESPSSGATIEGSDKPSDTKALPHPKSGSRTSRDETSTVRPRLHVSEERQWRTIAGHGPDLKRVPLFEWRALVDIASVKEKGILQGDLVRLTGQDKRSLPTRTDALARKGYIIKQPIVLRGGKSSKLWLAQFSEYAREHQEREGLDYDKLDLSKSALTSDLHPVSFCDKWNGETIDYLALAQAFVAIVKAWVLIRYCDARAKLGVEERVRQMRALAKTCRWLTNIGALSFVGAKFAGSNRLFKDCVKFIRDPSPAEWSHFRATPKTRMVVPSGRIGKRGEASRAVHASQLGGSRGGKAIGKKPQSTKSRSDAISHASIIPSPWKPQKPVPNTSFEIIKRAGSKGTSNAAICRQTLGHNYRRLTAAMTGSISMPTNSQPPHLKHLSSTSQLSRIGKTMTYTFYANSEIPEVQLNEQHAQSSSHDPRTVVSASAADYVTAIPKENVFSQPDLNRFSRNSGSSLTDITGARLSNRIVSKTTKRKRPIHEDLDGQPLVKLPRRLGRRPKKGVIYELSQELIEEHRPEMDDAPSAAQQQSITDQKPQPEIARPAPRPPGVYRGLPNSLDPITKRKGRRRRSLVVIFRSDRLKDPAFLGTSSVTPEVDADRSGHKVAPEITPRRQSIHVQDVKSTDASNSIITTSGVVSEDSHVQSRTLKSGKNGSFWCEKCGNSWKNSNGLEYHLTKSRTTCNPDFVPPSSELISHRKRKSAQPQVMERSSMPRLVSEDHRHSRPTPTPKEKVGSRFERKGEHLLSSPPNLTSSSAIPFDDGTIRTPHIGDNFQSQASRGSIILKDLEVFDATDHRRLLRRRIYREISTNGEISPATDAQPSSTHSHLSPNATFSANSQAQHVDLHNRRGQDGPLKHSPNTTTEQIESRSMDTSPTTKAISVTGHSNIHGDELPISLSIECSGARKPLPSISPNRDSKPSMTLTTQPHGVEVTDTTINKPDDPTIPPDPLPNAIMDLQSTHKSLAFFARPTRPNASFGARRRDRTIQIIQYLLEQNEGVFPGLRSLFMAVISVWAKEFRDLAPPDRRICQNTVNQMERDGVLKQMHFFFFDDQAKMQECVVLAKADTKSGLAVSSSDDPRVIAVKEKMREMFPEAYVPDAFSLSPDEAKLFDDLASQGKEHNQTRSLKAPNELKKVQDIETLRYENSVMGDISIHRSNAKRQMDEVQVEAQTLSKRSRVDVEQLDSLERTRKPRRRPDKHEMWDSGKLAVYIWSQRQKPGAMWDQNHSCLQDPMTGAWSWTPDTDASQLGNITTILSSVKSARHIDASLKRKGRKTWTGTDINAGSNKEYRYSDQNSREIPIAADHVLMADGYEHDRSNGPIPGTRTLVPFATNDLPSDEDTDEDTDDMYEDRSEVSNNESARSDTSRVKFTSAKNFGTKDGEQWSNLLSSLFETQDAINPAIVMPMPNSFRPSKETLPHDAQNILNTTHRVYSFKRWADPAYGEFLRNLKTIRSWEQSAYGSRLLTNGTIAPEHVYISLTSDKTKASMKPTNLEWLISNQFTTDNIPDEVKNSSPEDDNYGRSYLIDKSQKTNGKKSNNKRSEYKTRAYRAATGGSKPKEASRKPFGQRQTAMPQSPMSPTQPEGFIEYKTRDLTVIPKQPRGRFNKPAAHDDKLGSTREDELLAACVVFRTLLGGLDRNLDIGLLLKHFPGMSLSAIKKFWPRVSRERKSYVQALTVKFQLAFLGAYENGKIPPLDYDDVENYDWPRLILWTTQLETHEEVDLPESREALHQKHLVENVTSEAADWRETWFATTSTYNRIEAVASEAMSIPLPPKVQQDRVILDCARTWVRSICCTSLRGVNVKEKLVPKLLELGNGDAAETNYILEKVVAELNREKVITRTKGKDLGGNFRIHGMFSKQLEKMASTPKFRQAIAFKAQLDEVFRHPSEEYIMPYASDDGSIMAVLNLQAHGRIHIETIDMPNIPFGFEPGNYEGRTFPKSYYHFKVRLMPTETYLFNEDMALLNQSQLMEPPTHGPEGKIPIWVDFFGKVNSARWADYVSMVAFTLAIKGPIVPKMCVTLLKPMIDEFEVQLIIEWLDKLGLLQRAVSGCGVTAAEWWWLVAGHIAQMSDDGTGKNRVAKVTA